MDQGSARKSQMKTPHKSQAAAMDRAGELPDGEQLRECVNSGQVSAAQVVAHAENGEVGHPGTPIKEYIAKVRANPERAAAMDAIKEKLSSADEVTTGWPSGMLQDDSRGLSNALSRDPNARALAREWKVGNELLPFHHQASHVNPDYRDGWNAAYYAALSAKQEEVARLRALLIRYRKETPLGNQPHMIAHEVDAIINPNQGAMK